MWKAAGAFLKNTYHDLNQNSQQDRYAILLQVLKYLETTQLQSELEVGFNNRLLGNLWALAEIQKKLPGRLEQVVLKNEDEAALHAKSLPSMKQAQRFMRYSTAVYGPGMVAAVQQENSGKAVIDEVNDSIQKCLVQHVDPFNLKEKDVLVADTADGDSLECLRHVVTIDHSEKCIVLAIRGTLSLSSIYIDVAGFAHDFCGGKAHAGMATMARAVWNSAEASVKQKLDAFPDGYSLVLTGHSLGAGVACLICIMLHHEQLLPRSDIPIKCMAFAPPPVFYPLENAGNAVNNTTAYVHEYDVVPSLSCNALRRLMMSIVVYDQQDLTTTQRVRIEYGYDEPPPEIVEDVRKVSEMALSEVEGAPWLCIPAKCIVWLHKCSDGENVNEATKDDKTESANGVETPSTTTTTSTTKREHNLRYSVHLLDPIKYAERLIDLTPDMIYDHYCNEYEAAFSSILANEFDDGGDRSCTTPS